MNYGRLAVLVLGLGFIVAGMDVGASPVLVPGRAEPLATVYAIQTARAREVTPAPTESAKEEDSGAEATISVLQTQVAELGGESSTAPTPQATEAPIEQIPAEPLGNFDSILLNEDFELLYYYFAVDTSLYVFGEMRNVSDRPAIAPRVVLTFLDEDGNSYGDEVIFPDRSRVPGGERASFQMLNVLGSALLPGDWAEVVVTAGEPSGTLEDLEPLPVELEGIPLEGPVGPLKGMLRNNGPEPIGPVTIQIAFYDNEDRFVGSCTGAYLDLTVPPQRSVRLEIPAGGCGFFSVATKATNAEGPFTYRLFL